MANKRKVARWKLAIAAVVVIVGGGWGTLKFAEARATAEAEKAASRLRKMGYPVTIAEFRARLPKDGPDNAAPLYKEAIALMEQIGDPDFNFTSEGKFDERKRAEVAGKMEPVYQLLTRAAELPRCTFDRKWEDAFNVPFPEFAQMRNFVRICTARAEDASVKGNWQIALDSLAVSAKVANHSREPSLIGHLVSTACEAITVKSFYNVLARHRQDPQFLSAARQWLAALPPPTDRTRAHDFELVAFRAGLELIAKDKNAFPVDHDAWESYLVTGYLQMPLGRRSVEALYLNRMADALEAPYENAYKDVQRWRDLDAAFDSDRSFLGKVTSIFAPALSMSQTAFARGETHRRMADVALWVCEQRVQLGTFPYQLPDQERFHDPWTGKRFIYSTSGDQFQIRSVGPNKLDDGGQTSGGTRTDDDEVIIDPAKVR